jgi:hypothetical protein
MQADSTAADGHFGRMPIIGYYLKIPPRAPTQLNNGLLAVPQGINFMLAPDGRVQITSAGMAPSSVEIDKFTEDVAMTKFERFIEHAMAE